MSKSKRNPLTYTAKLGDCVELLKLLPRPAKLICADPPYNFGMPYEAHADNKSYVEYMKWTRQWVGAAVEGLAKHGSLFIFVPEDWSSEIDMMCRHEFGLHKRRRIVWAFTFGQKAQKNFTRAHCDILYYSKTKSKFTFNTPAVAVPSARQLVYNDKRAVKGGKPPDNVWMLLREQLEPYMTPDKDVWLQSRICGTFKEREKHSPNQLPVPLMERIILACSNPGDLVVDPFAGSGSSGVAAVLHGRNWIGFDKGKTCVAQSMRRITEARHERFGINS